jgi:aryl-alcohol dehydrogenase-like predicted oxidoreductase
MIAGRATSDGTAAYAAKHGALHQDHWRGLLDITLSSIGIGTYLGNADAATDANYIGALQRALESGINVVDTAINYRFQKSERNIGAALKSAIDGGVVGRDQVFLCTKGGYLAGDGAAPTEAWTEENIVKPGIATWDDIVAECHCMTPAYLKHQVDQSRKNLGVETIDLFYVHNSEQQMPVVGADEYYARLTAAFAALEECVAEGKIAMYGTATWDGYRVPKSARAFTSLERVAQAAAQAGGDHNNFRAIQLPLNFGMPEACREMNQPWAADSATALQVAYEVGAAVFTSVPLLQGKLLGRFSPELKAKFHGLETDAQRCLQFARSTPGVCAPLCGMKDVKHVDENVQVAKAATLSEDEFNSFFEQ